jgi:hypothetical protein
VSGLTIKDVNEIPTSINQRECPLLIPNPENYVSGAKIEVDSFGTGTNRAMSLHYNLNYLLIHSEVGVGRVHVLDAYSGMLTKATAFLDAVYGLSGLTGAVDFNALLGDPQITEVGAVAFHSIAISVQVQEFIN